jgi:hypothetical protein
MRGADGGDAPLEVVVRARLERDGRGLGHAVADRHVPHVHAIDNLPHDLDGARRARHDAGAQRRQPRRGEVAVLQLGDEHRRHAVERRARFRLDGVEAGAGIEALGRQDDGGTVSERREVAHHHAEAVVEGHRHADAVARGEPLALADEEAVVEDVVMGQRRALGRAGRAGGVLDVDRVVELQRGLTGAEHAGIDPLSAGPQVVPRPRAGDAVGPEDRNAPQGGQPRRQQAIGRRARQAGDELLEQRHVVGRAEFPRAHEQRHPGLLERELQLAQAVRRVDVHQHRAHLRRRVLDHDPFGVVGAPDADTVAFRHAECEQTPRHELDLLVELAVGQPDVLVPAHEGIAARVIGDDAIERAADGLAHQGHVSRPLDVGAERHGALPRW